MSTQTFNIILPKELVKKIDERAKKEYKNRSELIREAVRFYVEKQELKSAPQVNEKPGLYSVNKNQTTYEVVFEEAKEGGYYVYVPSLSGCISEGDTFEEAKERITEAISGYLESMKKDKKSFQKSNVFIGSIEIPPHSISL